VEDLASSIVLLAKMDDRFDLFLAQQVGLQANLEQCPLNKLVLIAAFDDSCYVVRID
jgi:hypothetical protein